MKSLSRLLCERKLGGRLIIIIIIINRTQRNRTSVQSNMGHRAASLANLSAWQRYGRMSGVEIAPMPGSRAEVKRPPTTTTYICMLTGSLDHSFVELISLAPRRSCDQHLRVRSSSAALRRRSATFYKKLSYRRGTARCVVSVEFLPTATQQCRNYLYDRS